MGREMIVSGGKVIDQCWYCGKYVTLNKWCGSLHICLTDEERMAKNAQSQLYQNMQAAQQNIKPLDLSKYLTAPKRKIG